MIAMVSMDRFHPISGTHQYTVTLLNINRVFKKCLKLIEFLKNNKFALTGNFSKHKTRLDTLNYCL